MLVVPESVAPPPTESVTRSVADVTRFPVLEMSSTVTVKFCPATATLGWLTKRNPPTATLTPSPEHESAAVSNTPHMRLRIETIQRIIFGTAAQARRSLKREENKS